MYLPLIIQRFVLYRQSGGRRRVQRHPKRVKQRLYGPQLALGGPRIRVNEHIHGQPVGERDAEVNGNVHREARRRRLQGSPKGAELGSMCRAEGCFPRGAPLMGPKAAVGQPGRGVSVEGEPRGDEADQPIARGGTGAGRRNPGAHLAAECGEGEVEKGLAIGHVVRDHRGGGAQLSGHTAKGDRV